jgi:hypothetical protein
MKKLEVIYAYAPSVGVVEHRVLAVTADYVIRASGIAGERLQRSDLDTPNSHYFTTRQLACEAFIHKAEAALEDSSRAPHHAGWRKALANARRERRKKCPS